jgi:hypothetical protein
MLIFLSQMNTSILYSRLLVVDAVAAREALPRLLTNHRIPAPHYFSGL